MSKKTKVTQLNAEPQVQEQVAEQPAQLNPQAFSYRQDGVVEMTAESFEILRAYMREQAQRNPPKKYFMHQKPVPGKAKDEAGKTVNVVEWVDFENDEEYKNQKPIELRDVDSFNIVFINNLLEREHISNIEKGNAVAIEVLRKEMQEQQESRLKKVEE